MPVMMEKIVRFLFLLFWPFKSLAQVRMDMDSYGSTGSTSKQDIHSRLETKTCIRNYRLIDYESKHGKFIIAGVIIACANCTGQN